MLRAGEVVAIVGASLVLTVGAMWTRSVAARLEMASAAAPAILPFTLQTEPAAQKPVRVVHPGYVRRPVDEPEPQSWVDPYRIRRIVERQPAPSLGAP